MAEPCISWYRRLDTIVIFVETKFKKIVAIFFQAIANRPRSNKIILYNTLIGVIDYIVSLVWSVVHEIGMKSANV